MNTSVASNSMPLWLKTRASSIVSAVPLPSSLTPGAGRSFGLFGSGGVTGSAAHAARRSRSPCPPGTVVVS